MPIKHVDKQVEAYLDNRLSLTKRRQVEEHIRDCPTCAQRLFEAERVVQQLGPVMRAALGRPKPPLTLRYGVKKTIDKKRSQPGFDWSFPVRFFNAVGTVAAIALLAFGLLIILRSQNPSAETLSDVTTLNASAGGSDIVSPTPLPTATVLPVSQASPTSTPDRPQDWLRDTLPTPTPRPQIVEIAAPPFEPIEPETKQKIQIASSGQSEPLVDIAMQLIATPTLPEGTLAYALYNPHVQAYNVHFINPDGNNHQLFQMTGVSEPALHPHSDNRRLAFRAWNGPTSPRSLFSGNLADEYFQSVSKFWEDAQPDWSPTEDRLIYASQRESDRRWRLYSVWGDGSQEVNLRREGRSPTFAPDGYHFAFESCNSAGYQCGLWVGDLTHSEYESKPILVDPLAKSPDWSPNGEDIVYMANPDGNWDLYLVNHNGNDVRRLTDDPAIDGLPIWSPDGQWLAFVSDRDEAWGLWLLHLQSGTLYQIITFEDGSLAAPDQPPYGEHATRQWWDEQLSWGQ